MNLIKAQRTKKNWTRKRLAEQVGVTVQTIHNYETYQREPNYAMLNKLSKALNVSMVRIILDFINKEEK